MLIIIKALSTGWHDSHHYQHRSSLFMVWEAGFVSTVSNDQELMEQNSSLREPACVPFWGQDFRTISPAPYPRKVLCVPPVPRPLPCFLPKEIVPRGSTPSLWLQNFCLLSLPEESRSKGSVQICKRIATLKYWMNN